MSFKECMKINRISKSIKINMHDMGNGSFFIFFVHTWDFQGIIAWFNTILRKLLHGLKTISRKINNMKFLIWHLSRLCMSKLLCDYASKKLIYEVRS